jgi:multidrug efflux pump
MQAVRDRLRPIIMTSLAFGLGVLPLAPASGAGSGAQRAIGTGVVGGMVVGTLLGVFFIPLFYVVVRLLFHGRDADLATTPLPARTSGEPPGELPPGSPAKSPTRPVGDRDWPA